MSFIEDGRVVSISSRGRALFCTGLGASRQLSSGRDGPWRRRPQRQRAGVPRPVDRGSIEAGCLQPVPPHAASRVVARPATLFI